MGVDPVKAVMLFLVVVVALTLLGLHVLLSVLVGIVAVVIASAP